MLGSSADEDHKVGDVFPQHLHNKNVTIFLDFFQNVSTAHLSSKCNDPFNNISVFFLNVFEAPS